MCIYNIYIEYCSAVPERLIGDEAGFAGVAERQELPDLAPFLLPDGPQFTQDVSHVGFGELQTMTERKIKRYVTPENERPAPKNTTA